MQAIVDLVKLVGLTGDPILVTGSADAGFEYSQVAHALSDINGIELDADAVEPMTGHEFVVSLFRRRYD